LYLYDEWGRDMLQHERIGDATVVSIRTGLDANTAHRAKETLDRLIAGGDTRLLVDLSNLDNWGRSRSGYRSDLPCTGP